MKTLTNLSSKKIQLSLTKEYEIKGIKTQTLEFKGCESLSVPDGILKEKSVQNKIKNKVLKSDGKVSDPPKPPSDPSKDKGGESGSGSKKSGSTNKQT